MSIHKLEDVFTYLHPLLDPANFESDKVKLKCNMYSKKSFDCKNKVSHILVIKRDSTPNQLLACEHHKASFMVPIGDHLCKYESKNLCPHFARYRAANHGKFTHCKRHAKILGYDIESPEMSLKEARQLVYFN